MCVALVWQTAVVQQYKLVLTTAVLLASKKNGPGLPLCWLPAVLQDLPPASDLRSLPITLPIYACSEGSVGQRRRASSDAVSFPAPEKERCHGCMGVCVYEYVCCCCCTPEKKRKTPRSIDERVNVCAALLPSMLPPWQGT